MTTDHPDTAPAAARARRGASRWAASLLLPALLAACTGVGVERSAALHPALAPFEYRPPDREPAQPVVVRLRGMPERVLPAAARTLEERGFEPEQVDPGRRLLVLRYRGAPEPWVDCGTLQVREAGEPRSRPAAAATLRADRSPDGGSQLVRSLRLDARVVVALRQQLGGRAAVRTTYVLTELVDRVGADGRVLASARETARFETGGVGSFREGMRCVATGRLEEEVARVLARVGR